jgi:uncharacterized membrane protein YfcA
LAELTDLQLSLIALIFVWSGFVRSGLGFGGAVLSLPILLLIDDRPLLFLPIIGIQLLFFSGLTVALSYRKSNLRQQHQYEGGVDWRYLRFAMGVMIVPKMIGVMGLIVLPAHIMTGIIFTIVSVYAVSYLLNKPFRSQTPALDVLFLALGGYVSGTSLIGAPLIVAVVATHVAAPQLRNTLFVLWFIMTVIKLSALLVVGIDMQLLHQLWLLPCAAVGHVLGLRFHELTLSSDSTLFYRILGGVLLVVSFVGLWQAINY